MYRSRAINNRKDGRHKYQHAILWNSLAVTNSAIDWWFSTASFKSIIFQISILAFAWVYSIFCVDSDLSNGIYLHINNDGNQ